MNMKKTELNKKTHTRLMGVRVFIMDSKSSARIAGKEKIMNKILKQPEKISNLFHHENWLL